MYEYKQISKSHFWKLHKSRAEIAATIGPSNLIYYNKKTGWQPIRITHLINILHNSGPGN